MDEDKTTLWQKIIKPYTKWKQKKEYRKRLKRLKEQDPFIYK